MKYVVFLILISTSAFGQSMPQLPIGWCGQVFCPPLVNPCGPTGDICKPVPVPIPIPQPVPIPIPQPVPIPIPQPAPTQPSN